LCGRIRHCEERCDEGNPPLVCGRKSWIASRSCHWATLCQTGEQETPLRPGAACELKNRAPSRAGLAPNQAGPPLRFDGSATDRPVPAGALRLVREECLENALVRGREAGDGIAYEINQIDHSSLLFETTVIHHRCLASPRCRWHVMVHQNCLQLHRSLCRRQADVEPVDGNDEFRFAFRLAKRSSLDDFVQVKGARTGSLPVQGANPRRCLRAAASRPRSSRTQRCTLSATSGALRSQPLGARMGIQRGKRTSAADS